MRGYHDSKKETTAPPADCGYPVELPGHTFHVGERVWVVRYNYVGKIVRIFSAISEELFALGIDCVHMDRETGVCPIPR